MLQIQAVSKQYKTGDLVQHALREVSLNLRDNEFVSILGPSGSGKTTLLNIIGGLDRYDSGDLIINGVSTRNYTDRDWDTYRNHTIGFVFQSYNLIPHQSVLSNVELALTIAGISPRERRARAKKALEQVGLGEQCHKKPNQMSGGQMQRVAIARALVNDPDILLADEPTGALDTETSLQVMELLKEVAKDRLVVMVTHNPELAEQYSTRIVRLRDGRITSDSDPYDPQENAVSRQDTKGKAKMGFQTALALSFNNLRTKLGRTILTAFAGSIGIIGIAMILALSNGVNTYINNIQKETMASYPISITARTIDMSGMLDFRDEAIANQEQNAQLPEREGVYSNTTLLEMRELYSSSITENNLTAFRAYLENPDSEIQTFLGENGIIYSYNVNFSVFTRDPDGNLLNTDTSPRDDEADRGFGSMTGMNAGAGPFAQLSSMMGGKDTNARHFSQLMPGADGSPVSSVTTDSYEVLYGRWPEKAGELVLVLDRSNGISIDTLFSLGLITLKDYQKMEAAIVENGASDPLRFDYETICARKFLLVPACDYYKEQANGDFAYVGEDAGQLEALAENGMELTIVGIIRPLEDAANANISSVLAYTSALTDQIIAHTDESPVVIAQESQPERNVLTGLGFDPGDDETRAADAAAYIRAMDNNSKASLYTMILYYTGALSQGGMPGGSQSVSCSGEFPSSGGYPQGMDQNAIMAAAMDHWLDETPDQEILLSIYDQYFSVGSYDDNMEAFGKVSYDAPASISIYTDSFEDKESVSECITRYNETVGEEDQITYVDYVQLMTSSLTSIIDVISYVLIAFVSVSLVVSCIMIGIITHISVLERTKEIGILRAMGASKGNISNVFNAETLIIGLCSGVLGVVVTMLLTIPINALLAELVTGTTVTAQLPPVAALILVAISMIITVIGGLMPARKAARLDPVIALRSE